jgi:hypothetical protein
MEVAERRTTMTTDLHGVILTAVVILLLGIVTGIAANVKSGTGRPGRQPR